MTLAGTDLSGTAPGADPFGLWQSAAAASTSSEEMVSFGLPGTSTGAEDAVPVWQLPLTSGPVGQNAGEIELERRAAKIRSITAGLDNAAARAETLISARAAAREQGDEVVSFAVGGQESLPNAPQVPMDRPEASLFLALNALEPSPAEEVVSYGLGETISQVVSGINWEDLRGRLDGLLGSVNQQLLHFAWVETTLDGMLVARTTVNWGGDMITLWRPGLPVEQSAAHCRSLELAMASRAANLRTVLTVSQIAGKIALAVATPLGPIQAMSLGWQFVQEVVMPLLNQNK